jgi:hypothetical protein
MLHQVKMMLSGVQVSISVVEAEDLFFFEEEARTRSSSCTKDSTLASSYSELRVVQAPRRHV